MTTASEAGQRVTFGEIMRGVVRSLPDTVTVNRGLWTLATARPGKQQSLGTLLERNAEKFPDDRALYYSGESWTWSELNAWANRYAACFRDAGIGKADCVGVLMENRPEALVAVAAAVKLGAVAGMLNHHQRGKVLAHSIGLIRPKLLVLGSESVESWRDVVLDDGARPEKVDWVAESNDCRCPEEFVDLEVTSARKSGENPPETGQITHADPCFYIFTSGTTGLPKASVMSHGRWIKAMAGMGLASLRLRRDDTIYCALPLYHNNALTVSWGAALGTGAALALAPGFSASGFWDDIRRSKATCFCYIGELCRYLLQQPPGDGDRDHNVRVVIGNGLRPELWDEFKQRFGIERINEFYGASEGNAAFTNGFGVDRSAGYCPMPFAIVEYDLAEDKPFRDSRGHMLKVEKGGVGLLITKVTRSASFDGYTDPDASEKKLLRDVFRKGDCWFNTGDLVRDQGWRHIQFVDRLGDTFRWKGENVATTEVEAALTGFDQIGQAVVYGVEVPGADGRAGMAALTLGVPWSEFQPQSLALHLQSALPAYAVPLFLRLRPQQETTGTFKYRKVDLKAEGFDNVDQAEPVYVLRDRLGGYEPLDATLLTRLRNGELKF